jgi:hypothetical protein
MSDHNRLVEQIGVYHVGTLAGILGCLFRQVNEHDKGVDAEIELTQSLGVISPDLNLDYLPTTKYIYRSKNKIFNTGNLMDDLLY